VVEQLSSSASGGVAARFGREVMAGGICPADAGGDADARAAGAFVTARSCKAIPVAVASDPKTRTRNRFSRILPYSIVLIEQVGGGL
jgi:hypothetical protein